MGFYPEIQGHRFEIKQLEKLGEQWYAEFWVDGRLCRWFEPESRVHDMQEGEFLDYMASQAMTMLSYNEELAKA